eukprot:3412109-Rhodomonas_salina.2
MGIWGLHCLGRQVDSQPRSKSEPLEALWGGCFSPGDAALSSRPAKVPEAHTRTHILTEG